MSFPICNMDLLKNPKPTSNYTFNKTITGITNVIKDDIGSY